MDPSELAAIVQQVTINETPADPSSTATAAPATAVSEPDAASQPKTHPDEEKKNEQPLKDEKHTPESLAEIRRKTYADLRDRINWEKDLLFLPAAIDDLAELYSEMTRKEIKIALIGRIRSLFEIYSDEDDQMHKYYWELADRIALEHVYRNHLLAKRDSDRALMDTQLYDYYMADNSVWFSEEVREAVKMSAGVLRAVAKYKVPAGEELNQRGFVAYMRGYFRHMNKSYFAVFMIKFNVWLSYLVIHDLYSANYGEKAPFIANLSQEDVNDFARFLGDDEQRIFYLKHLFVEVLFDVWPVLSKEQQKHLPQKFFLCIQLLHEMDEKIGGMMKQIQRIYKSVQKSYHDYIKQTTATKS